MNSALTRPQSLQELYKTYFSYASRFKFTDLLKNYIQNEEWKDKSQKPIWDLLSTISDDIGAVLTDDIVNYTRNVVDINTCKVPQLIEHAKMLSYGLEHLKNSYDFFPAGIRCLVDIFSVNQEYLIGNHQNHILSDEVIKEILIYIKENGARGSELTNDTTLDRLLDDPHGLTDYDTYREFVRLLFKTYLISALSAPYSSEDPTPIAFNLLWEERENQRNVLSRIDEYRTWIDRYIWNEIEYPLNDSKLDNTLLSTIEQVKQQKRISPQFHPFKEADRIYFNGLRPTSNLSQDEISLVEMVLNYHAKTKYDYRNQRFSDDTSTQYAYYKELDFCEYVKSVMFIVNNLNSFRLNGLTYDISTNKFIQTGIDANCLRVVNIFNNGGDVVEDKFGNIVINDGIMDKVSKFLCDYVFHIQGIRENIKTISQKHAMRGTGALLVHIVNDYLIKELPIVRDLVYEEVDGKVKKVEFEWEVEPRFRNYGNVKVLEYEDDNEYFNIDPVADVRFTARTNERYWEQLEGMGDSDQIGVFTKKQIKDFYRDTLGMGRIDERKPMEYDDVVDFLVDLFKIGANPIKWDASDRSLQNPIDDITNNLEEDYGYDRAERRRVQDNAKLRKNQDIQFREYSGNEDVVGGGMYALVNNKLFYWKNVDYSSHVLHPLMYNLKLWNKLNNIIINGYKDYADDDIIKFMESKNKFNELFGEFGEARNFWKYNVMDLTGYTTRYEAAIKDERLDDFNNTISRLTGYDGLFYPDAAREFLDAMEVSTDFSLTQEFFKHSVSKGIVYSDGSSVDVDNVFLAGAEEFLAAVYSIYWQEQKTVLAVEVDGKFYQKSESDSFYTKWYSHLNYTRSEYQKIAMQLWYWRDRIQELITTEYPITKYCLDIRGNSLMLVQTFKPDEEKDNPFLIDLQIAQSYVEQNKSGNENTHVPFCDGSLVKPCEFWIRWKSNPIALPAFDIDYDQRVGDSQFDERYRKDSNVEMGQLTHTNNDCNDNFKVVMEAWRESYGSLIAELGNRLPVFFDMEQSANILALASWGLVENVDEYGIQNLDQDGNPLMTTGCFRNPLHIVSKEVIGTSVHDYTLVQYGDNSEINATCVNEWLFDAYHYCPANGSILIPLYKFDCQDYGQTQQNVMIRMFVVPAQRIKNDSYSANDRIVQLEDIDIDLNQMVPLGNNLQKFIFDRQIKVCRNTNFVFSAYDVNGMNRVKCAFLGVNMDQVQTSQFKTSSCQAKTRYDFDSQTIRDLSMLKGNYYRGDDDLWYAGKTPLEERRYIDESMAKYGFNSYDSLDKYVFVIDFQASIDNKNMFDLGWKNGMEFSCYNILGDSGYIPHFAYQSLVRYSDRIGGIAYTWANNHLKDKTHMQFELLGLDDNQIETGYKDVSRMVVEDVTDDCKTLICPERFMDDIYRVWCETRGVKGRLFPGEEDKYGYRARYDSYFDNEYRDYQNPELDFRTDYFKGDSEADPRIPPDPNTIIHQFEPFELDLPMNEDISLTQDEIDEIDGNEELSDQEKEDRKTKLLQQKEIEAFKSLLDEYCVSVLRTDAGQILNEKRYLLPPTPISQFVLGMGEEDGFMKCSLSRYQTSMVQENHYVKTQTIFVGTPDPFNYGNDGERIYSRPEELQYGNCLKGVGEILLKIDISTEQGEKFSYDVHGNIQLDESGKPVRTPVTRKFLVPTIKFRKFKHSNGTSLTDRLSTECMEIPEGSVTVIFSHKNLDNLAKYHILNRISSLYFDGSLPKNGENHYKFSDFKYDRTVKLAYNGTEWESLGDDGQELKFTKEQVVGANGTESEPLPPYYLADENGNPIWFLQQDRWDWHGNETFTFSEGQNIQWTDEDDVVHGEEPCPHRAVVGNPVDVSYSVPEPGGFVYAHRVKSKPEKYLDYLYIKNGGLSFKVSEESQSFADAISKIPPFYIDEVMKNKLNDLNNIQILKEYSTFIHQSEQPDEVKNCNNFNPLVVEARLQYGLEQRESSRELICTESGKAIQLDNLDSLTRLNLQLEDGEIDDFLKIYTNYVRKDDGNGDWHYDLYFNVQNLLNSPFEYISSVTKQPNVLIIPDSYLYLTGDKFRKVGDHNEIDDKKVENIKRGGVLSLYGQVKTYSDDKLSDVKTIKLFEYRVYNISDDKPKFLIEKTYDIKNSTLSDNLRENLKIEFSDVMWTVDESDFVNEKDDASGTYKKFMTTNRELQVVQPVSISYNWDESNDNRINQVSFDIVNDVIDFNNVVELYGRSFQNKTLRNWDVDPEVGYGKPYYDHWSDRYMTLEERGDSKVPHLTLKWDSRRGFNFETIYLKWKVPIGCNVMDTIDRLGGYLFSSTAANVVVECNNSGATPVVDVKKGHVQMRVHEKKKMYLGLEHSTTKRKNGYVLIGLAEKIQEALERKKNPTLEQGETPNVISEDDLIAKAKETQHGTNN